jgi:hypothetical protein
MDSIQAGAPAVNPLHLKPILWDTYELVLGLSRKTGACYACAAYLAKQLRISESVLCRRVKTLCNLGLLVIEHIPGVRRLLRPVPFFAPTEQPKNKPDAARTQPARRLPTISPNLKNPTKGGITTIPAQPACAPATEPQSATEDVVDVAPQANASDSAPTPAGAVPAIDPQSEPDTLPPTVKPAATEAVPAAQTDTEPSPDVVANLQKIGVILDPVILKSAREQPELCLGWIDWARSTKGLKDPAGLIAARIRQGVPAPLPPARPHAEQAGQTVAATAIDIPPWSALKQTTAEASWNALTEKDRLSVLEQVFREDRRMSTEYAKGRYAGLLTKCVSMIGRRNIQRQQAADQDAAQKRRAKEARKRGEHPRQIMEEMEQNRAAKRDGYTWGVRENSPEQGLSAEEAERKQEDPGFRRFIAEAKAHTSILRPAAPLQAGAP